MARASTQDTALTAIAPEGTDIRRFDDDASAMQALLSGQVDAIGCSTTVAAQIAKRAGDAYENKFVLRQQFMAVAMRPNQADLLKATNDFVAKNTANGELSKLYQKWLGSPLPTLHRELRTSQHDDQQHRIDRPRAHHPDEKVSKWFGQFQVLTDVDLDVRAGERIVICGPSGSGKSTLIRCINHLEKVQQGRIVVDGIDLTRRARTSTRCAREVGMVFQQFNLFPHLTVLRTARWRR